MIRVVAALVGLSVASAANAQWVPGSELVGQQVQVQTNGITNLVYFGPDGVAEIRSPSGATVVQANWIAQEGHICLRTSTTHDCYPYRAPFEAGRAISLTSDCAVQSVWVPLSVAERPGERG